MLVYAVLRGYVWKVVYYLNELGELGFWLVKRYYLPFLVCSRKDYEAIHVVAGGVFVAFDVCKRLDNATELLKNASLLWSSVRFLFVIANMNSQMGMIVEIVVALVVAAIT